MTTNAKEDVHRLVDELPEGELHAARRFLQYLRATAEDPVLRAFMAAPEDDESLTPEDVTAIEEGEADIARGDVVPWEAYTARPGRN